MENYINEEEAMNFHIAVIPGDGIGPEDRNTSKEGIR